MTPAPYILSACEAEFGHNPKTKSRRVEKIRPKWSACYLLDAGGVAQEEIGRIMGMHGGSVAHALHSIKRKIAMDCQFKLGLENLCKRVGARMPK
jgi:hypothetical protein